MIQPDELTEIIPFDNETASVASALIEFVPPHRRGPVNAFIASQPEEGIDSGYSADRDDDTGSLWVPIEDQAQHDINFITAVKTGSPAYVRECLMNEDINVRVHDTLGNALHHAIRGQNIEIATLLLTSPRTHSLLDDATTQGLTTQAFATHCGYQPMINLINSAYEQRQNRRVASALQQPLMIVRESPNIAQEQHHGPRPY